MIDEHCSGQFQPTGKVMMTQFMLRNILLQQAVKEIGLDGLCSAARRDGICLTESVLGDFVPALLSCTIPPDSAVTDYATERALLICTHLPTRITLVSFTLSAPRIKFASNLSTKFVEAIWC